MYLLMNCCCCVECKPTTTFGQQKCCSDQPATLKTYQKIPYASRVIAINSERTNIISNGYGLTRLKQALHKQITRYKVKRSVKEDIITMPAGLKEYQNNYNIRKNNFQSNNRGSKGQISTEEARVPSFSSIDNVVHATNHQTIDVSIT